MKENESALHSQYIIDGIRREATPAELLDECMDSPVTEEVDGGYADVVDETTDPPLITFSYDPEKIEAYMDMTLAATKHDVPFRMLYPETFTRQRIAKALLERLWNAGHFRLGDLSVWMEWEWNTRPLGNMAAFYQSVSSASEYLYDLGVKLQGYSFEESDAESRLRTAVWLPERPDVDDDEQDGVLEGSDKKPLFKSSPYQSRHPWITNARRVGEELQPDEDSWLIYIPFDTASHKLGGSLLAESQGNNGGAPSLIQDPDYFIDCFEVVRELVEDGIVISGAVVMDGGLMTAVRRMCTGRCGISLKINGILASYQGCDRVRALFAEIPGVLLQIGYNDYDYVDGQLLLQDVAYYPLGHPSLSCGGNVSVDEGQGGGLADILASLIGQATEGED